MYALTKNGNIKTYKVSVDDNTILRESGLLNGKITTKEEVITKPKNIGKSNELSPNEVAKSKAKHYTYRAKVDGYKSIDDIITIINEGKSEVIGTDKYVGTEEYILKYYRDNYKYNSDNCRRPKPMLANKIRNDIFDRNQSVFVQRKYNGIRCMAALINYNIFLFSRDGKLFNIPHITEELKSYFKPKDNKRFFLDGEIYIHGKKLQDIISLAKAPDMFETLNLEFHVFDMVFGNHETGEGNKRWFERLVELTKLFKNRIQDKVKLVDTVEVFNQDELSEIHNKFTNEGYEGSILRLDKGLYEFGYRSNYLLKLKSTLKEIVKIENVVDTDKEKGIALFVCRDKRGNLFNLRPNGSVGNKVEWFNQANTGGPKDPTGKEIEITFHEHTKYGIPFHITKTKIIWD